jgi:hypothetical protein
MDDDGQPLREAPPEARAAMYRSARIAARDTRRFALGLLLRRRISWRRYRRWCRDARADVRAARRELRRGQRRHAAAAPRSSTPAERASSR